MRLRAFLDGWKSKWMTGCGIILGSFVAGSLVAASVGHLNQAAADGSRVFELRIYHAAAGKMPALESRFRDTTSQLLAKHDLKVVGYWISEDAAAPDNILNNTFVFIVAHPSREQANKNWDAMWVDPGFQQMVKSEKTDKLVEKVDATYMRSTDFSPLK